MSEGLVGLLCALQPPPPAPPRDDSMDHYDRGRADGQAAALAMLAPLRQRLAGAAAALEAAAVIDADGLRPVFAGLVKAICEVVLARELAGDGLEALVAEALALVTGEAAVLTAHPDTLAALGDVAVPTAADPAMARDALVVSGLEFTIDVNIGQRLADIMAELS